MISYPLCSLGMFLSVISLYDCLLCMNCWGNLSVSLECCMHLIAFPGQEIKCPCLPDDDGAKEGMRREREREASTAKYHLFSCCVYLFPTDSIMTMLMMFFPRLFSSLLFTLCLTLYISSSNNLSFS